MITTRETFRKAEKLCSRKVITNLFEEGNTFYTRHFKIIWGESEHDSIFPVRIAFIVPKKGFRHAVRRNLLKRRMREAYRKNKYSLYKFLDSENIRVALLVIFRKDTIEEYSVLETAMREMLDKIRTEIKERKP